MNKVIQYFDSPVGLLEIVADGDFLTELNFSKGVPAEREKRPSEENPSSITHESVKQLEEFFSGKRKSFSIPLKPNGTQFQLEVWNELQKIPFNKTISYLELARRLGDEKKIRAAGTANGKNPIAIIIPCHRVIGSDGSMVGYGGGLWRKKWLLEFESGMRQSELY